MPVRIYDISKKLGLENKEVLSKAKELGIAAARVASSSLDKITAEYLEEQLRLAHPNLAATPSESAPAAPPPPVLVNEPITIVSAPPPEPEPEPVAQVPAPAEPPAVERKPEPIVADVPPASVEAAAPVAAPPAPVEPEVAPPAPAPPPPPEPTGP